MNVYEVTYEVDNTFIIIANSIEQILEWFKDAKYPEVKSIHRICKNIDVLDITDGSEIKKNKER
jgi:hypothetical protein